MPDTAPANLHAFSLDDLAQFTADKSFPPDASPDYRSLYVGFDDVHEALKYLLSRCRSSLVMNMFGFDDDSLNDVILGLITNSAILVQITLDKSQAGGVHEKKLLDLDRGKLAAEFGTHFAIGQSATHSISHTKGGVIDGVVAWEGSTNWSADGEGTFVIKGQPGGPRYRAQNNTVLVHNNGYELRRFTNRLHQEHAIALIGPSARD
jgi:hypothetical protein